MESRERRLWRTEAEAERGSFTVEACIAVVIFIISVFSIFSLCNVIETQHEIQLALDSTALEISADMKIASAVVSKLKTALSSVDTSDKSDTEKLLLDACDGLFSLSLGNAESSTADEIGENLLSGMIECLLEGESPGAAWFDSLAQYGDNPASAWASIAGLIICEDAQDALSHAAAVPVCRAFFPKYICSGDASAYLEKRGIEGGLEGIDFSASCVLPDGNAVSLCAVYEIKLSDFLPVTVRIVQSSYTGSLADASEKTADSTSVWTLGNLSRGKKIVELQKKRYPSMAVKAGYGFDLYDKTAEEYISVISLNPFSSTYSDFTDPGEGKTVDETCYIPDTDSIYSEILSCARELKRAVGKTGLTFVTERGRTYSAGRERNLKLRVVFPEEASAFSAELEKLCAGAEKKSGVIIETVYYDTVF